MSCSLHWRLTEQGLCVGASKDVGTSVLLMLYMFLFFFFFNYRSLFQNWTTCCLFDPPAPRVGSQCCCSVLNWAVITAVILLRHTLRSTLTTEGRSDHVFAWRPRPCDEMCPGVFWGSPRHGKWTFESSPVGSLLHSNCECVVVLFSNVLKAPFA